MSKIASTWARFFDDLEKIESIFLCRIDLSFSTQEHMLVINTAHARAGAMSQETLGFAKY